MRKFDFSTWQAKEESEMKLKAAVVGGTGMVGQRFITLLENHPWFEVSAVAASAGSAGKTYDEAINGRWKLTTPLPESVKRIKVQDASRVEDVVSGVDLVFCAVDMKKDEIKALEEAYARTGTPVISNNSAHRWTPDVPMVIPEINARHIEIISSQRKRLGTKTGFIAVKPNCSIQSYVPAVHAVMEYTPLKIVACTYQAISGAGKTFEEWPEMVGQRNSLYRRRGRKKRAGTASDLGHDSRRRDRQSNGSNNHNPMHPRAGFRRTSCCSLHYF